MKIDPATNNYNNKFVITGGPGFGKTTVINKLEEMGYVVFREAARTLIEEQKKHDDPIFPWKDRIEFDRKLIKKMMSDYQTNKSSKFKFYDRGIPDLIGWREYADLDSSDVKKLVSISPYEKLVFSTKPWQEIYESNEDRPYSFEQACKINKILTKSYSDLGYFVEYLPNKDTESRVGFILEKISEYKKYN
jgi:predicted ATPase